MTPPGIVCEFCGRTLSNSSELTQHIQKEHAGRPRPPRCPICYRTFESPADLKAHNESYHRSGRA
jgi:hypothetical protein